jgi:hypothetical protein
LFLKLCMMNLLFGLSRSAWDILPGGTWGVANSQVSRKTFYGEGPELASGEEAVERQRKVLRRAEERERWLRLHDGQVRTGRKRWSYKDSICLPRKRREEDRSITKTGVVSAQELADGRTLRTMALRLFHLQVRSFTDLQPSPNRSCLECGIYTPNLTAQETLHIDFTGRKGDILGQPKAKKRRIHNGLLSTKRRTQTGD